MLPFMYNLYNGRHTCIAVMSSVQSVRSDPLNVTVISASRDLCLVSTIPLPFFRSVATVAVSGENGNAGNVFPCTCIGMKRPERWLVVRLRQNDKNGIRSYCYGTVRRNGKWKRQRQRQRNGGNQAIYTAISYCGYQTYCRRFATHL